jgi:ferric-dicitrate binding protein FerR (iron transport regulator)
VIGTKRKKNHSIFSITHLSMDYSTFTLEDFISDESFQAFVYNTDVAHVTFWKTWIAQHPEKNNEIEQAIEILNSFKSAQKIPVPVDKNLELQKLLQRTSTKELSLYPGSTPVRQSWNWMYKIAAVLVGILLLGAGYFAINSYRSTTRYSTNYGETQEIILPDSSTVILNANSKLRYASQWNSDRVREVWLEGEAFFSVRKKQQRQQVAASASSKFIVHTQDLHVEVLGTEFTVSERREQTRVTLNSGKIKLDLNAEKETAPILMQPGEQVVFSSEKQQLKQTRVKPEIYSSWAKQVWILEDTPLSRVAEMIEETFGMKVIIEAKGEIAKEKMTGVVPIKNIDGLLEGLSTIYQLQITKKDNTILIRK